MNDPMPSNSSGQPKRRGTLLALLVLFLGPLLVSLVLYFGGFDWRPAGTVEHGLLLNPVRPLPPITFAAPNGEVLSDELLEGIWSLVQLNADDCDDVCVKTLIDTRQVRLSLGRRITRVQRVLINDGTITDVDALRAQHPDLIVTTSDGITPGWISTFRTDEDTASPWTHDRVYVIDPLGNVVMVYEPGFELRGLQDDMKRLLRLSRIG